MLVCISSHDELRKMDETLRHKFTQHSDLREELLSTGDAELVEVLIVCIS